MELRQLHALKALSIHGSFSKAALSLHISQPSLSSQIQQLEIEIGSVLVIRGKGKKTYLSPVGKRFLEHVDCALGELAAGIEELEMLSDTNGGMDGVIRVSVLPSIMATWLPQVLINFLRAHPYIELVLEEDSTEAIRQQLDEGHIDLGIITDEARAHYSSRKLFDEPFVAIVPADVTHDDLTTPKDLADFADYPFILYKPGYASRDIILEACARNGFTPKISFESGRLTTIIAFVKFGFGCSLIPQSAMTLCGFNNVMPFTLKDAPMRTTSVIWRHDHILSKIEQYFISSVCAGNLGVQAEEG